jgi:replicative DNA helicase
VQHQITPEDFDDADFRAIYTTFLRLASQDELIVFPRIMDEVTSSGQQELLSKMAMGPVLSSQAEISKALDDCLADIQQRQLKAQRQSIIEQLRTIGDGTAEQQRLLQEYNRLSKEQTMSFS